ncbi:MAG: hypothetical protein IM613_12715 [Cytophagales bacterium]|nr:hypothetical protein [Cytophagales bacterium]
MAISLIFDKFGTHPIDPADVSQASEQVFSLRSPSGDYLTDLNFARITQQISLKGVPKTLADTIDGYLSDYATAVVTGAFPTPNVTIDGKAYAVKTVEKGASVTINGNVVYPNITINVISNDLTIV